MTRSNTLCVAAMCLGSAAAFTIQPAASASTRASSTELQMGLFDGVKDAFSTPGMGQSALDSERETPIDRWMGWSVSKDTQQQAPNALPTDYVDSMVATNYVAVALDKPMGIVFEENDEEYGGIFVQSLKEDSVAASVLKSGDQLVFVDSTKVSSMVFDEALSAIVESKAAQTKLVLFRGTAKQFYGPTGASQAWLDEFLAGGAKDAVSS